jgi:hypothetical protein
MQLVANDHFVLGTSHLGGTTTTDRKTFIAPGCLQDCQIFYQMGIFTLVA